VLRAAIAKRLGALGLELPVKTKIVCCKDANRRGDFEHTSFDFLGYTFRGRLARGPRGYFTGFSPAISSKARKAKGQQIRAWHLNRRSGTDLSGLAEAINPQVRGWINYYGAFYRSELRFLAWRINEHLARGVRLPPPIGAGGRGDLLSGGLCRNRQFWVTRARWRGHGGAVLPGRARPVG
jgi:RNA-directed DNA polymerase